AGSVRGDSGVNEIFATVVVEINVRVGGVAGISQLAESECLGVRHSGESSGNERCGHDAREAIHRGLLSGLRASERCRNNRGYFSLQDGAAPHGHSKKTKPLNGHAAELCGKRRACERSELATGCGGEAVDLSFTGGADVAGNV